MIKLEVDTHCDPSFTNSTTFTVNISSLNDIDIKSFLSADRMFDECVT